MGRPGKEFLVQDAFRASFRNQIGEAGITGTTLNDDDKFYVIAGVVSSGAGTITIINMDGDQYVIGVASGATEFHVPVAGQRVILSAQITDYHGYYLKA